MKRIPVSLLALLWAVGGLLAAAPAALAQSTSVTLVRNGRPVMPIVVAANADPLEKQAAQELAKYLGQITSGTFEIENAAIRPTGPAIVIGRLVPALPADLGEEGYVLRTRGEQLHVAGGGPRGTRYAVYGLLEDELGCRWWSYNEEHVPSLPTITLKLDDDVRPAFRQHHLFYKEGETGENNFVWKRRGRGLDEFTGNHTLCPMLKPYADQNPAFLPMNDKGERKFNNLHMCYSAQGMSEALAEALSKEVEKRGGRLDNLIYFAGMGDWYGGMCQCPDCRAVYEEETWTDPDGNKKPAYTATLLRMINKTAEILDAKYPGIRIGTFAYMSLEAPPAHTMPRDNVAIWVPHLRHCIVHGIDECAKNRHFLLNLQRWTEIAPDRVYIWDYGISFANFLYPMPNLKSLARNIQLFDELGVAGNTIQGNYVSMGSDMIAMRSYVWGKLHWDPSLDPEALIAEFCRGYYGPAGEHVQAYVNALEDSVRGSNPVHLDEFAGNIKQLYLTDALIEQLDGHLQQALAAAGTDATYQRRVREAMVSLESVRLWNEGPLREESDRLVRADLGDTWERALALVEHARGASPREWGDGRSYRMGFLTFHGGPLVNLRQGDVEVMAAPTLNGRIRRLRYKGQDLLLVPPADAKGANAAGAYESLNPGAIIYTLTEEPTAATASFAADLGIAHWGSATKQVATKTLELASDGTLRITGKARAAATQNQPIQATAVMEYDAGKDPTRVAVEYRDAQGAWHDVVVPEGEPDRKTAQPNLPAHTALRVTLQAKGAAVTDDYAATPAESGWVWFDPARGGLITQSTLPKVTVPAQGEPVYMQRKVQVQPAN